MIHLKAFAQTPLRWTTSVRCIILGFTMKTSTTTTVDAAAILSSIWARNALRREAGLPLWPVRATFERELTAARWRAHLEQHYNRVRDEVSAERRAQHGETWGLSAGGRWAAHFLAMQKLKRMFSAR